MAAPKFKGFGYAINYAKEIAYDQSMIDILSNPTLIAVCALVTDNTFASLEPWEWLVNDNAQDGILPVKQIASRANLFGLTLQNVSDLMAYLDMGEIPGLPEVSKDWYKQGKEMQAKISTIFTPAFPYVMTEAKRKKALAKYKSDLARHKRNQLKNG
jgi:hypothetical protein